MSMQSGHWNPNGVNVFSQECIDRMFGRNTATGADVNGFQIDCFEQALAHFKAQGKVVVVNE